MWYWSYNVKPSILKFCGSSPPRSRVTVSLYHCMRGLLLSAIPCTTCDTGKPSRMPPKSHALSGTSQSIERVWYNIKALNTSTMAKTRRIFGTTFTQPVVCPSSGPSSLKGSKLAKPIMESAGDANRCGRASCPWSTSSAECFLAPKNKLLIGICGRGPPPRKRP